VVSSAVVIVGASEFGTILVATALGTVLGVFVTVIAKSIGQQSYRGLILLLRSERALRQQNPAQWRAEMRLASMLIVSVCLLGLGVGLALWSRDTRVKEVAYGLIGVVVGYWIA
jgi:uncharacterized membrane protein YczE